MASPFSAAVQAPAAGQAQGAYPDLDFRQLDSWIVIRQDNTATFYVGKTDLGQGTGTAFRQVMSDELDIRESHKMHYVKYGTVEAVPKKTRFGVPEARFGAAGRLSDEGTTSGRLGRDQPQFWEVRAVTRWVAR
jgi:hypothetical protein